MKKALSLWLALVLFLLPLGACAEEARDKDTNGIPDEYEAYWVEYDYKELTVGNPTPLQGKFFTTLWGGNTSDLDVQELLHGYNLVRWDGDLAHIRFNHSVVSGALAQDDDIGRTYYLALQDDLFFSDGTPVTAYDYAFSLLLQMNPVVNDLGGQALDVSWLYGSDEYLSGEKDVLEGVRVIDDQHIRFIVKKEALPYFFELSRFNLKPYPIEEIAPGCQVADDGEGAYLKDFPDRETLEKTILDPETGYMAHPKVVSGPYKLTGFDGVTAHFSANDYYKGNEQNQVPELWTLHYTLADNENMIQQLGDGEFGLLNKVTLSRSLHQGVKLAETQGHQYTMSNYARVGLTLIWFALGSEKVQDNPVRQAIAYCLDREKFVRSYVGPYGLVMDAFCGLGHWTYALANGTLSYNIPLSDDPTPEEERAYDEAVAAWEEINLDGLEKYSLDVDKAITLLESDGWTLNEKGEAYDRSAGGARYKRIDGELVGLNLTMGMPYSDDAERDMEKHFLPYLAQAGILVTTKQMDLKELQKVYDDMEQGDVDLLYLGENFSIIFDPEVFISDGGDSPLAKVNLELNEMAKDMVRTEPTDVLGFMRKWVRMQERLTRTLPLIPIYSNVYFDFYTRELYDYNIAENVTWSDAIIAAYMAEPETYDDATNEEIETELEEMELLFIEE